MLVKTGDELLKTIRSSGASKNVVNKFEEAINERGFSEINEIPEDLQKQVEAFCQYSDPAVIRSKGKKFRKAAVVYAGGVVGVTAMVTGVSLLIAYGIRYGDTIKSSQQMSSGVTAGLMI
jgi:hypothetical protein